MNVPFSSNQRSPNASTQLEVAGAGVAGAGAAVAVVVAVAVVEIVIVVGHLHFVHCHYFVADFVVAVVSFSLKAFCTFLLHHN